MGRPVKAKKKTITTMRLDDDLLTRLAKRAKREVRSRSNLIETILIEGLAAREKKDGVLG